MAWKSSTRANYRRRVLRNFGRNSWPLGPEWRKLKSFEVTSYSYDCENMYEPLRVGLEIGNFQHLEELSLYVSETETGLGIGLLLQADLPNLKELEVDDCYANNESASASEEESEAVAHADVVA